MSYKIFLDMDGVLADFIHGAINAHGLTESPWDKEENLGTWDMGSLMGISQTEFWEALEGASFWERLPKTKEADLLVDLAVAHVGEENVYFLTSPTFDPDCYAGKAAWVKKHYPNFMRRFIPFAEKELLATEQNATHILIDDADHNVERWEAAGGVAIQMPRPWNKGHSSQFPFALVYQGLNNVLGDVLANFVEMVPEHPLEEIL